MSIDGQFDSVVLSWLLLLLHQPRSWPPPNLKTPVSRSETTIGIIVITTTGTTAKTAPTAVTWQHHADLIGSTTGNTTECSGTTMGQSE
jgi:hypothetical protein